MQTKIEEPFYIVYTIKDGFYACLIALFVYSLFYSSIYVGVYNKIKVHINQLVLMRKNFLMCWKKCLQIFRLL